MGVNYYPFGWSMPGRQVTGSEKYRFGFNGMERDDELKGEGNSYDFGARLYDNRIGRWLSVDPVEHAHQSPYSGFDNNPIIKIDPDGKDALVIVDKVNKTITVISIYHYTDITTDQMKEYGRSIGRDLTIDDYINYYRDDELASTWGREQGYNTKIDGEDYNVKFETQFVGHNSDEERNLAKRDGTNILTIDDSEGKSYFNTILNMNTQTVTKNEVNPFSHEKGHALGVTHGQAQIFRSMDGFNGVDEIQFGKEGEDGSITSYARNSRTVMDFDIQNALKGVVDSANESESYSNKVYFIIRGSELHDGYELSGAEQERKEIGRKQFNYTTKKSE